MFKKKLTSSNGRNMQGYNLKKKVVQQVGVEFYVCNTVGRKMYNINFSRNAIWDGGRETTLLGGGSKRT